MIDAKYYININKIQSQTWWSIIDINIDDNYRGFYFKKPTLWIANNFLWKIVITIGW